ncbi:hypothetical protein [Streptacidiphilus sp. PAMC 29251]
MPVLTPCPSHHNAAWRRAEAADQPHELTPVYGNPIHCLGCQGRAYHQLAELPELLAAVWLEAEYGTAAKQTGTIGRIHIPSWPGQASRLMTDMIVGGLTELEDDLRELRHLNGRPDRGREGPTASGAVTFLLIHLDWALVHHPAATEIHDRDSANPAAQIDQWHRAVTRFTRRDSLRVQLAAPCPRCALRTLAHEDGEEYIECRNPACGALLTDAEYATHAGEVAAQEAYEQASCA